MSRTHFIADDETKELAAELGIETLSPMAAYKASILNHFVKAAQSARTSGNPAVAQALVDAARLTAHCMVE